MTTANDLCPKCHGVGYYIDEETNTTYRCDCELAEREEYEARLATANIPAMFQDATIDSFQAPPGDNARSAIKHTALAYAETVSLEDPEGLILKGTVGCGKTHIAVGILKEVIRRGYTGYYTGFMNLLNMIRNSYHPDFPLREEEVLQPLAEADFLVLDDMGAETPKDFVTDRLYLIVNRRYEARKPMLITTNLDDAELEARVGARTYSRLCQMCDADFPPFPNVDMRRRIRKSGKSFNSGSDSGDHRRNKLK